MSHNILMLLRTVEALEKGLPGLEFDMKEVERRTSCGSISCIIGHVLAVNYGSFQAQDFGADWRAKRYHMEELENKAGQCLGLSPQEAHMLFFPDDYATNIGPTPFNIGEREISDVTPYQAAKVLKYLAVTGNVDWEQAFDGEKQS